MPGAIEDGAQIAISAFNHGSWQPGVPPIGKGRVRTTSDAAFVQADFFDTAAARDTIAVLKGLGPMGRWSFGFDVLDEDTVVAGGKRVRLLTRLRVFEAAPVLVPANDQTRTLVVSMAGEDHPDAVAQAEAAVTRIAFERALAAEAATIRDALGLSA
jgi:hypothetical protein